MALDRISDPIRDTRASMIDFEDRDAGRSNFVSFLIGGVVVAGGLLAFLFYDGGSLDGNRDFSTGSFPALQGSSVPGGAQNSNN